eukprot:CAMPEP_0181298530 /NCGR_PEP_ID=MMETSP1101-20121128/5833_1 /TAXON_ID=46948 /ORGANISM="Rhodomonas abbreviata, Strain Caron Lab Isolate" /LENGTH=156 /DNA_ID=CAMNT_0023403561 /DNA_START=107 /DNA_END=575 /DNA_ORIENTATION=+
MANSPRDNQDHPAQGSGNLPGILPNQERHDPDDIRQQVRGAGLQLSSLHEVQETPSQSFLFSAGSAQLPPAPSRRRIPSAQNSTGEPKLTVDCVRTLATEVPKGSSWRNHISWSHAGNLAQPPPPPLVSGCFGEGFAAARQSRAAAATDRAAILIG